MLCGKLPAISQSQEWITCKNLGLEPGTNAIYPARGIEACTKIIQSGRESKQNLATAYFYRGVSLGANNKQYDRALADYNEAISLNPYHAYAYRNRGAIFAQKGDFDRALADYDESVNIDPNFAIAYKSRAEAYEKKGDLERARADYRMTLAVLPKDTLTPASNRDWVRERVQLRLSVLADSKTPVIAGRPETIPQITPAPELSPPAIMPILVNRGHRVALVIGNSVYTTVAALPNPWRDAQAVAAGLRNVGFKTVMVEIDTTRDKLVAALRAFEEEADKADWAVIYYAGHGIEIGGVNYLIPIDAKLKTDKDAQDEAVPLDRVLSAIEGAKKLRLVVLDACRDNPFIAQMRRTVASRSIGRGLGRIEPEGGTLVAYAAKHGQIALDGAGQNSPFVSAFIKHLKTPNLEINKLFRLVRDDVMAATGRRQEPFVYGSLPGEDFFFVQR